MDNNNNDFIESLCAKINSFGLPLKCKMNYLSANESLVVYASPGGKVIQQYMDGESEVALPFEIAVKSKDPALANDILWTINDRLSDKTLDIQSHNGSFSFSKIDLEKPFLGNQDQKDWTIYLLDLTATITTNKGD